MKKLFLMAVMTLFVIGVSAQSPRWGVKAGLNMANLGGDISPDARIGFHAGVTAEFGLTEMISLQPEALVSLKGCDGVDPYYLEVPINVKFNFPLNADKVYLAVGPYVAYGISGSNNYFDANKSLDYGIGIGAGYDWGEKWVFSLGYQMGLANINDLPAPFDWTSKQNNVTLSVGYKF